MVFVQSVGTPRLRMLMSSSAPVVISSLRDLSNLTTIETVQYTIVDKGTDRGWLDWARGEGVFVPFGGGVHEWAAGASGGMLVDNDWPAVAPRRRAA